MYVWPQRLSWLPRTLYNKLVRGQRRTHSCPIHHNLYQLVPIMFIPKGWINLQLVSIKEDSSQVGRHTVAHMVHINPKLPLISLPPCGECSQKIVSTTKILFGSFVVSDIMKSSYMSNMVQKSQFLRSIFTSCSSFDRLRKMRKAYSQMTLL